MWGQSASAIAARDTFSVPDPGNPSKWRFARVTNHTENKKEWDVFAENHFLGHVTAPNEEEAIAAGIQLFGSHLEGILKVQRRVQTPGDGWSRPI